MLEKVRAFWITGVLEHSLHQAALLTLGLNEQQDAIANPWHLVIQQPDQPESPLPPGTSITEVYNDAGGELLILGEPGSGKTTLLLELTRHLLDHAEQDDTLQIPVVFNLSSWATKQRTTAALSHHSYLKYIVLPVFNLLRAHCRDVTSLDRQSLHGSQPRVSHCVSKSGVAWALNLLVPW